LEKEVNTDISLRLEIPNLPPFLNTGSITENFNLVGKIREERDTMIIPHKCVILQSPTLR
jgi:hypothetical protein